MKQCRPVPVKSALGHHVHAYSARSLQMSTRFLEAITEQDAWKITSNMPKRQKTNNGKCLPDQEKSKIGQYV